MPDDPLWDDLTPEEQKLYAEHANVHKLDPARRRKKPQAEVVTEQSVMLAFAAANKDRFRYNHSKNQWLEWSKHSWREDGKQTVLKLIDSLCRAADPAASVQKANFAAGVERIARRQDEFATEGAEWDSDPIMLGTPGGVVDLESGSIRPGLPDDMISKTTAVAPCETEDCPRWLAFLDQAFGGNTDNIAFFKRFCGYFLTGSTKEEMLLFIVGKPGTGKGTATKTIVSILRDYALNVPATMFTENSRQLEYYRAELVGRRLVLASEPEKSATWNDAFVNELTGGDRISGRFPAGRMFTFDPNFKLCFQGEQIPDLKHTSTGLKRRMGLLKFDNPPETPDPNLKDILHNEWPGILRWMINGCLWWQTIGLAPPPDVTAEVEDYFANQDVLGRWIEDRCIVSKNAQLKPSVLLQDFNQWAEDNNEKLMNERTFTPALNDKGYPKKRTMGKRLIEGLALRPTEDQLDQRQRYDPSGYD